MDVQKVNKVVESIMGSAEAMVEGLSNLETATALCEAAFDLLQAAKNYHELSELEERKCQ